MSAYGPKRTCAGARQLFGGVRSDGAFYKPGTRTGTEQKKPKLLCEFNPIRFRG
jgi:hypothetical protein